MKEFVAQTRKAAGTAIVGAYAWGWMVISSASGPITGPEWMTLAGVGVAVAAVYGLTNDVALPVELDPYRPAVGTKPGPTPQGKP